MQLQTLGGLALLGTRFKRPKPLLLLAYLALEGAYDRRHLAELFWPGAAEPMGSLRVALSQLRAGAPGALAEGARLGAAVETDAVRLLAELEAGALAVAVRGYGGAFLEGFYLAELGAELEEWVYSTREFLAKRVRSALLALAEGDAAVGDFRAAARRAQGALALPGAPPPDAEELARLYRLLVAGGSPRAAELLEEAAELGLVLTPSREEARAELFREGAEAPRTPHNLPPSPTSFVGRDPELVELTRLLAEADTRLVTVLGAGGAGKSRLALEAARQELRGGRWEGVYLVALEALVASELIPTAIARALGLSLPGRGEPLAELARAFGDTRLLLVLDNCEHLPESTELVRRLLQAGAGVKVLATSRAPLGLAEEQRFILEGLPVPDALGSPEEARRQEAVQLFWQRARRAKLDFALTTEALPAVLELCRLVEGSPLGIELAAAWVRLMPPEDVALELRRDLDLLTAAHGAPARHRSLRATFDYSWRLLTEAEQAALRKLSVFEGGFSRAAAAEVAGATIPLLAAFADKSLLRVQGDGRFDRHPLVYGYSREKLAAQPQEEAMVQTAHARVFLRLAEEAEAEHRGAEQARWLERLEREQDNLRAALRWSLAGGAPEVGLKLAVALFHFWYYRSHLHEGGQWLEKALEVAERDEAWAPLRSRLLSAVGALANERGDDARALALFEARLALARAQGDLTGQAAALNSLGVVAWGQGDYARAQGFIEASLLLRRELTQPKLVAPALNNLGLVALAQDRLDEAQDFLAESLAISQDIADEMGVAMALSNLGAVALERRDASQAERLLGEATAHYRTLGDQDGLAHCLEGFAAVCVLRGQAERAARLAGAAEELRERVGAALSAADRARHACARRLARQPSLTPGRKGAPRRSRTSSRKP